MGELEKDEMHHVAGARRGGVRRAGGTLPPGTVTSMALGEEDGGWGGGTSVQPVNSAPVASEPEVTSMALGEEDSGSGGMSSGGSPFGRF